MLEDGSFDCSMDEEGWRRKTKKKKKKNSMFRNRFSDDQIRQLESMFESESRLEPRKKMEVATELGHEPRQVAIWFQNKRARWKSKQLEHDFNLLRANYDSLLSRFQALNKEKQGLASQLQKLNDEMGGRGGEEEEEEEEKPCLSFEGSENGDGALSDLRKVEEEDELKRIGDGSTAGAPENWSSLNSDALIFEQSNNNYEWWDFWS